MKKIAILQSNYIPWKGYFDLINMVDVFVIYDEMQYTRRDWRNRNKIKTAQGSQWLSIPVEVKGKYSQKIRETKIGDKSWAMKHWRSIVQNYAKSVYFKEYKDIFEDLYKNMEKENYLSEINYTFIKVISEILGIDTKIIWSNDLNIIEGKTERLVDICEKLDGTTYLSGPSAQNYIDESLFLKAGITVEWMDYNGYPEYSQLYPPFEHGVTILDLIFNTGKEANKYMKSFNNDTI
ncbi:WbqC-like family protein [Denitrovibrio acetiphilus DSM 12809]|uniref:WbqC-like family protein n=1 Tax=Denitrovibrio acetiphilus (strain DSM 12809 / NBRC 114555 / N2460) TaxID=522772 RepID=D4H5U3_DENA2|nr:WbqC family protein [Denitrovibrio acetiphilus]ADD69534.1 WbqC-like family protein [Denitrovibrio acetiphilus DSM 12809]